MRVHAGIVVALALVGLGAPGCCTYQDPATGAEATYAFETLKAELDLGIGTVYTAAKEAVNELSLRTTRAAQDGISGEIRAVDAQLDRVEIRVGALPGARTQVAIRVGLFGDRDKSIVVFEQIMANLSGAEQLAAAPALQWGREERR
jgi:hypothetical protein